MPSLNLDLDYFEHVKTQRLVGLLGRGAEVLPIRLWCACGKHRAESGTLAGYSAQEIEALCAWWGKSGQMVKAMVQVGFLDRVQAKVDGKLRPAYAVHNWRKRSGHLVAYRIRAQKAAEARWEGIAQAKLFSESGPEGLPENGARAGPSSGFATGSDATSIAPSNAPSNALAVLCGTEQTRPPVSPPARGAGNGRPPRKCPECGGSWRAHQGHPRYEGQPSSFGMYCLAANDPNA